MPSASIAGRVALITGASSGIGAAIAEELAGHGCPLILWARRREKLEAVADGLREAHPGLGVTTQVVDVTDHAAMVAALGELEGTPFATIDILVNNAGLALGKDTVQAFADDDLRTMIETNCVALARLTRLVLPAMLARDRGDVLMISSVAAHYAYGGGSIYTGTKHFVRAFTDSLREDVVASNVRVSSISPGAVRTEFSIVRFKGDEKAADAVYAGIDELTASDVADAAGWIVTRPPNVQIGDITMWATRQATPTVYGRRA